jgi:hypothetical protein
MPKSISRPHRIGVGVKQAIALVLTTVFLLTGTLPFGAEALAANYVPQPTLAAATQLPQPDPKFAGKVGETYKDSVPSYPQPLAAPEDDPNVLLILLDDVGFGMTSTFGGPVPTPNLDKLASNGLSYTRFHTTALCSPTRAALLTGRNHHSVGTGVIIEMGTGYPGYTGIIPKSTALVSETLKDNGYATAMFGKWHNTPEPPLAPPAPSTAGPPASVLTISMALTRGKPTSTTPPCTATRCRWTRLKPQKRAITSPQI